MIDFSDGETIDRFLGAVRAKSPGAESEEHGERHWRAVGWVGARLLAAGSGGDPSLIFLFAALHDAARAGDGHDPNHGTRAAALARALVPAFFQVTQPRLALLEAACEIHADGHVSHDPTVGTCWDADRLCLWRVGMTPNPRLLSTAAAGELDFVASTHQLHVAAPSWGRVIKAFREFEE